MDRSTLWVIVIVCILLGTATTLQWLPKHSSIHQWKSVNEEVETALTASREPESVEHSAAITDTSTSSSTPTPNQPLPTLSDEQTAKVNINTATAEELDTLPGIGPAKAKAIIAFRQANGTFRSLEQLMEVKGIGPKIFAKLSTFIQL